MPTVIICVGLISFALGRISRIEEMKPPIAVERAALITCAPQEASGGEVTPTGAIVASDSGTKYYTPGCSGASKITLAHKIYFSSETEAKAAGYSLAVACTK